MIGLRPRTEPPWVIAHRGASHDRPENTVGAFDEALAQGSDAIELDVQLTRDGVPVVYHDRTLYRAGGGLRRVRRVDLDELRRLSSARGPNRRIPTLREVLARYLSRTRLLVELKSRPRDREDGTHLALAGIVGELLAGAELAAGVAILSFDVEVLEEVARRCPSVPRVLNVRHGPAAAGAVQPQHDRLAALSIDVRHLEGAAVEWSHARGLPALAFPCDRPRSVARALAAGVDGLITGRPAWLLRRLEQVRVS